MPSFDRKSAWTGQTLALRVFRMQFAELNAQYWGGVPSEVLASRIFTTNQPGDSFNSALGLRSNKWVSVANTVEEYQSKFESHRRWSTLLTLTLLASCFEHYVTRVSRAAVGSDPLLAPVFPSQWMAPCC